MTQPAAPATTAGSNESAAAASSSENASSALEGPGQQEQDLDDRQRERLRQREELLSFLTESDGAALDTIELAQVANKAGADTSVTFLTPALQRDAAVGAARRQQKEAVESREQLEMAPLRVETAERGLGSLEARIAHALRDLGAGLRGARQSA